MYLYLKCILYLCHKYILYLYILYLYLKYILYLYLKHILYLCHIGLFAFVFHQVAFVFVKKVHNQIFLFLTITMLFSLCWRHFGENQLKIFTTITLLFSLRWRQFWWKFGENVHNNKNVFQPLLERGKVHWDALPWACLRLPHSLVSIIIMMMIVMMVIMVIMMMVMKNECNSAWYYHTRNIGITI